jgi:hypothetical protein
MMMKISLYLAFVLLLTSLRRTLQHSEQGRTGRNFFGNKAFNHTKKYLIEVKVFL